MSGVSAGSSLEIWKFKIKEWTPGCKDPGALNISRDLPSIFSPNERLALMNKGKTGPYKSQDQTSWSLTLLVPAKINIDQMLYVRSFAQKDPPAASFGGRGRNALPCDPFCKPLRLLSGL